MDMNTIAIISGVLQPVVVINREGRIAAFNRVAEMLLGKGLEGRHYITALRQPAILDSVETVQSGRAPQSVAPYLTTEAGRDVTFEATVMRHEIGGETAITICFVDRTNLQEIGQMRSDFVANVSHELRTPLTALIGFIETLRGSARDDAEARERFLAIMQAEAERMNRLISDLLSLSLVEAEERVRPAERVALGVVARATIERLGPTAKEAGARIAFAAEQAEAEGLTIPGDADQLSQVLSNLIENAIRYGGSENEIGVALQHHARHSDMRGPAVTVAVSDTGPGIDPIHLPRLTERFYRVDSHRSREMGSTGLGLAIVKHIVGRHRGRLRINSDPGQGTCFTVVLPAS
ncbi:MAG: two-component sensor histidine kinase [Rhodobacteraceae bacterium]|nr:two-component sensor histidine kinase [Paracoccaceae bacterium]